MRALIAMSGGVDSSLAAKIMKDRGYDCVGCTMKLFHNEDVGMEKTHTCCSVDDVFDARSICYQLGFPHYVFNFTDRFREKVMDKFVQSYESGLTPNPCIDCNRYLKFEKLYERAKILNCDCIVTGHYARIQWDGQRHVLKKAVDERKDQSYVLYSLTQEQLAHTVFPLGDMRKTEVRRIAEENHFITAEKPDSQDICFVPQGDYAAFLEQYTGKTYPPGDFISTDGTVLGQHKGTIRYTIGQRKGLGLSFPEPMYVQAIDPKHNTVTLAREVELYSQEALVGEFNWISGELPQSEIRCKVKIRYRQPEQDARIIPMGSDSVRILFDKPQRAITPGQAAVLYDGGIVLGGGVIR